MQNTIRRNKVAVVGARGYTGVELCRILERHPGAALQSVFVTDPSSFVTGRISAFAVHELGDHVSSFDTVFLATPAEASMKLAALCLEKGASVIDLSGAFRLEASEFEHWYGMAHDEPGLIARAEYGLVPWAGESTSDLISNPGCYASSVLMAILPLLKEGLLVTDSLVIDAKSGTTGAGRKPQESLLFSEIDGNCTPYRVGRHQHLPEIRAYAAHFAGVEIDPLFTTHLLPVRRGILSGIYARLAPGVGVAEVQGAFAAAYSGYPLVRHAPLEGAEGRANLAALTEVVGSAATHISYAVEGGKLYLFSAIDNLLKGAASQAIENFNRLNHHPPFAGLSQFAAAEGGVS